MKERLNIEITSAPAVLPVTRDDVKTHTRIDASDEDTMLDVYIQAARDACEQMTGRTLITTTRRVYFDRWPSKGRAPWWDGVRDGPISVLQGEVSRAIELPYSPLQSITHLKTYDDEDNATTFASSNYFVDTSGFPGRLVLRTGIVPPTGLRVAKAYEIEYVCGYGDGPSDIPAKIRLGVQKYAAHAYENRGDEMNEAEIARRSGAASLWRPYARLKIT